MPERITISKFITNDYTSFYDLEKEAAIDFVTQLYDNARMQAERTINCEFVIKGELYSDESPIWSFHAEYLETDEEMQARIERDAYWVSQREQQELETYERLKAKYESI